MPKINKPIIHSKTITFKISSDPNKIAHVEVKGYLIEIVDWLELAIYNQAQRAGSKFSWWKITELTTGYCLHEAATRRDTIKELVKLLGYITPEKRSDIEKTIKKIVTKRRCRANPEFKDLLKTIFPNRSRR